MIRQFSNKDLEHIMQIWLESNIKAHYFIEEQYWLQNYDFVKKILPQAQIYVYANEKSGIPDGFIGITDNFINGLFVRKEEQRKGLGTQLLNNVKRVKNELYLKVYEKNIPAIAFYRKEQFAALSCDLDMQTGEKEILMRWRK